MITVGEWWMWGVFFSLVIFMLTVDIVFLHGGKAHRVSLKESSAWVAAWMSLAILFGIGLWVYLSIHVNPEVAKIKSLEFFTGYLIEWSLSVDNLFVFLLIFNYFSVPPEYQRRTLLYGILGAIIMRLIFISIGVWLVAKFHWLLYLFGLLLIYSGFKIFIHSNETTNLDKNPLLIWMRKHLRITDKFHGERFFIRKNNLLYVTPLFVVLILIEASDVIFAVDSIPAIFVITHDPFIIYTSNIFAIMGLRAMYFMLAKMHELFEFLTYGVAFILIFIGFKMLASHWFKVPTGLALGVIFTTLISCVVLSIWKNKRKRPM